MATGRPPGRPTGQGSGKPGKPRGDERYMVPADGSVDPIEGLPELLPILPVSLQVRLAAASGKLIQEYEKDPQRALSPYVATSLVIAEGLLMNSDHPSTQFQMVKLIWAYAWGNPLVRTQTEGTIEHKVTFIQRDGQRHELELTSQHISAIGGLDEPIIGGL